MKIFLASRSPRRRELLEQMNVNYSVIDIEVNEDWDGQETAVQYVRRVTLDKVRAGYQKSYGFLPVLSADTSVVLDHRILGKAENDEQARDMLHRLSGRSHEVLTAVALKYQHEQLVLSRNRVCFRTITPSEITDYLATREPLGKAGGYAVQGYAARFISRLEGSYSAVVGLPIYETDQLLKSLA